jgi:hypothetical protein
MEAWYSAVRKLKDNSEDPRETREFCFRVYHDLRSLRIKQKAKFMNREGTEFDSWTDQLEEEYSPEFISAILSDNAFWDATLAVVKTN